MTSRHRLTYARSVFLGATLLLCAEAAAQPRINELRSDNTGADTEFIELSFVGSGNLGLYTYVAIGDGGTGVSGSGVVEEVIDLPAVAFSEGELFLIAESGSVLADDADLVLSDINLENEQNTTHLIVTGWTGTDGLDLDSDNDGELDADPLPWDEIVDLVAMVRQENPPSATVYHYGPPALCAAGPTCAAVGPDGSIAPGAIYRVPDTTGAWRIGGFDLFSTDTPGASNGGAVADPGPDLDMGPDLSDLGAGDLIEEPDGGDVSPELGGGDLDAAGDAFGFDSGFGLDFGFDFDLGAGDFGFDGFGLDIDLGPDLGIDVGPDVGIDADSGPDADAADLDGDPDAPDLDAGGEEDLTGRLWINEVRTDQPSTDDDEYFELRGEPGVSLEGVTLLVIGDGTGGSGVVERVYDLPAAVMPGDGYYVVGNAALSVGSRDAVLSDNFFENDDNLTLLLVQGNRVENNEDLDAGNDGTLDRRPWRTTLDVVALLRTSNPPASGNEWHYGPPNGCAASVYCAAVGPDGTSSVKHAFRCDDGWRFGLPDPSPARDTPGRENACSGSGGEDAGFDAGGPDADADAGIAEDAGFDVTLGDFGGDLNLGDFGGTDVGVFEDTGSVDLGGPDLGGPDAPEDASGDSSGDVAGDLGADGAPDARGDVSEDTADDRGRVSRDVGSVDLGSGEAPTDDGCDCAAGASRSGSPWWLAMLAGAALLRRRKRLRAP